MSTFFALILSLFVLPPFTSKNEEVSWTFDSKRVKPHTYVITATATINNGWYVYSQYLESNKGPISTHLVFDTNYKAQLLEQATEQGSKVSGYDELFDMNITKYKKEMVIQQTIVVPKGQRRIKGSVVFMSCNDHQCMPPDEVSFELRL
jgi:thiol:disulfide interchange protein DsbD